MSRDWKPGDVAMVTCKGDEPAVMVRDEGNTGWHDGTGLFYWDRAEGGWELTEIRPLVVIDPDSRGDVERLVDALSGSCGYTASHDVDFVQAALREFANPTPPRCDDEFRVGGSRGIRCELDAEHTDWHRSNSSEVAWS